MSGEIKSKFDILPQNIIEQIVKGLTELAETTLWGTASSQSILTLNDIKSWFKELPAHYKKKIVFAAVAKIETTSGIRVYQGILNKKFKCILARQLLVEELSVDLLNFFGQRNVIIFIEDPKIIEEILPPGD